MPDADTLFRIASISKTFTAVAVMQLRDEGRLRLDDPYVLHVPEFAAAVNPFGPIEDVTIRRLLTHTSGLQGEPPNRDPREYAMYLPDDLVAAFDRIRVVIPPDSATKYCNLGFELLGILVERLRGQPFREVIAERITGPLGLASTVYDATPEGARPSPRVGPWATSPATPTTPARARAIRTRPCTRPTAACGRRSPTWPAGSSPRPGRPTPTSRASTAGSWPDPRSARCTARTSPGRATCGRSPRA